MTTSHTLVLAVLTAMSVSACGSVGDEGTGTGKTGTSTPSPSESAAPPQDAGRKAGTPIRVTFGNTRLDDNATARELTDQLPLTLTVRDHNGVEKTAPLPRPFATDGAPEGHDPAAGTIGSRNCEAASANH